MSEQPPAGQPNPPQPGYPPQLQYQQPQYQQPGGYPPAPQSRFNGLGLASLIVGGLSLLFAFVPFANYASGFFAFIGIVLGIIGLVLKGRAKLLAIIGTAISVIALILSIVLAIVYTAGFVNAVDEAVTIDPPSITVPESTAGGSDSGSSGSSEQSTIGTREDPAPFGSTVTISTFEGPVWDVSVGTPVLNAIDQVKAGNQFNPDPAPGNQYAIIPATVTYLGDSSGRPFELQFSYVSPSGQSYDPTFVVLDGQLTDVDELLSGASGSGNVVFEIPSEGAEQGTWSVSYVFSDEKVYFGAK